MKDISIVQKLVTWTVVLLLLVIGASVFFQKEENLIPYEESYIPVPAPTPEPIAVYPNNGKE